MKTKLKWILNKLVHMKIYISRTTSWMSVANSVMLVFLVLEKLNSLEVIETDLGNSLFLVMVLWFFTLVFVGWVEVEKLRAPHMESNKMIELNPPMMHVINVVNRIEKKVNDLERKLNEVKNG